MPRPISLFRVKKAFFHAAFDLVVLTGEVTKEPVRAGMWADLPREVLGPGRVLIRSVEYVTFTTGQELAITINFEDIVAPRFDPSVLEGHEIEVCG
jgi:hypothetical protein